MVSCSVRVPCLLYACTVASSRARFACHNKIPRFGTCMQHGIILMGSDCTISLFFVVAIFVRTHGHNTESNQRSLIIQRDFEILHRNPA